MADTTNLNDFDLKTRANLAYIWSFALILMIGFTLWEYGHILAVLTLIIGFITGTAATVLAVYFGSAISSKKTDTSVTNTGDNPQTTITPPTAQVPLQQSQATS